jgi:hypothetical protein
MNCYDCRSRGRTNAAIGLYHSCGAGVCADCLRWEAHDHAKHANPGNATPRTTRYLTCPACDAVLTTRQPA